MDVQVAIGDIVLNQEGGAEDKKAKARENRVLKTEAVLDVKKAMKDAGCPHVKVRCFSHPRFDGFINKGIRSFGMRSDIRIAGPFLRAV